MRLRYGVWLLTEWYETEIENIQTNNFPFMVNSNNLLKDGVKGLLAKESF